VAGAPVVRQVLTPIVNGTDDGALFDL